jgi:hypothetical protein
MAMFVPALDAAELPKKLLIVEGMHPKWRPTQAGFVSDRLVIASARAGGHLHNRRFIGGGRESGSGNLSGGDKPSGT